MNASLLRNLGVDEAIIQALQKSYGDDSGELEILKDGINLKLILKKQTSGKIKPQVMTLQNFFQKKLGSHVAETTEEYQVQKYNCQDTLEFLPNEGLGRVNFKINGEDVCLGDSLYKLLRYLAEKLKETPAGWVYVQDLKEKGIIPSDGYQPFSRLRGIVARYLLEKDPRKFIEANGQKQYRISTNPNNVRLPAKGKGG